MNVSIQSWRRPLRPRALLIAAGGVIVVASLISLWAHRPATPAPAVELTTSNVVATAPGWVDVEGGVQRLGVRTDGNVIAVAVHEGQRVARGALLLRLDDQPTQMELRAAEIDIERRRSEQDALRAQLARARGDITRLTPLVAAEAEPAEELRAASARAADLQSQLDLAHLAQRAAELQRLQLQQRLDRLQLRAPGDGEVLRVMAHVGDTVAPGTTLLSFVGNGPRIVRAELDERLFGQVSAGMRAEVAPEYDDMKVYDAQVLRVASAVGPVQALPELHATAKDDRVVECVLSLDSQNLLIGQRVLIRILGNH